MRSLGCKERLTLTTLETVLKHCTKYEPLERPSMEKVVSRLEKIIQATEAVPAKSKESGLTTRSLPTVMSKGTGTVANPWAAGSRVARCFETFASRLEDAESRQKLDELTMEVSKRLGPKMSAGVYNPARLFRFLCWNEMDVADTTSAVVVNKNARDEYKMDSMRERIVSEDLSFHTLPRAAAFQKYAPYNPFLGRSKGGHVFDYFNYGDAADFQGLREAFSVEEYTEFLLFSTELYLLAVDALSAIEARDIPSATFYDLSGGSLAKLFGMLEYLQLGSAALRNEPSYGGSSIAFVVNVPLHWKMILDMLAAGSGYKFDARLLPPGTSLREEAAVTDVVEVSMLPKAIGGDALSVDENGETDERCCAGFKHWRISAFIEGLESS